MVSEWPEMSFELDCNTNMEDLLTPQEAAQRKGVAVQTIYKAIAESRLPSQRVLGRIGLRPGDVEAYQPGSYGEAKRARRSRGPGRRKTSQAAESRCAFITDEGEVFEIPDGPTDLGRACAVASEQAFSRFWASPEDEAAWGDS